MKSKDTVLMVPRQGPPTNLRRGGAMADRRLKRTSRAAERARLRTAEVE